MAELKTLFGTFLRHHRKRLGWSQVRLAEEAGISLETVARVERGISGASLEMIDNVAHVLGVRPAALFGADTESADDQIFDALICKLANLDAADLAWAATLFDAALAKPRLRRRMSLD